jgi:hypothetical protein
MAFWGLVEPREGIGCWVSGAEGEFIKLNE